MSFTPEVYRFSRTAVTALGLSFGLIVGLLSSACKDAAHPFYAQRMHLLIVIPLAIACLHYLYKKLCLSVIEQTLEIPVPDKVQGNRRNLADLPPVYPNGWFKIANSVDFAPGTVRHITALGQDFAVYRTKGDEKGSGAGKMVILDAYCPHLGANLAVGGKVKGNCLECPFHGWSFDESGKCVDIPYAKKIPEVAKTPCWTVLEQDGSIYVWHDIDRREPQWNVETIKNASAFKYNGYVQQEMTGHIQEVSSTQQQRFVDAFSLFSFAGFRFTSLTPATSFTPSKTSATYSYDAKLTFFGITFSSVHIDVTVTNHVRFITFTSKFGTCTIVEQILPIAVNTQSIVHTSFYTSGKWFSTLCLLLCAHSIYFNSSSNSSGAVAPLSKSTSKDSESAYVKWFQQFYSPIGTRRREGTEW